MLAVSIVLAVAIAGAIMFTLQTNNTATIEVVESTKDATENTRNCTDYEGLAEEQCIEDYVGLTSKAAFARAESYGYFPQTVKADGVDQGIIDIGGFIILFETEDDIVVGGIFGNQRQ